MLSTHKKQSKKGKQQYLQNYVSWGNEITYTNTKFALQLHIVIMIFRQIVVKKKWFLGKLIKVEQHGWNACNGKAFEDRKLWFLSNNCKGRVIMILFIKRGYQIIALYFSMGQESESLDSWFSIKLCVSDPNIDHLKFWHNIVSLL